MDWLTRNLLPHLVNGVSLGLLFALIALGFMLIVGVMETINLAHGSLFALGMYFALFFVSPQLGWFPDLQAWYMALPIETRYLRRPVPGAGVRRPVRHAAGAVHAAHLRARSALRPAADLRRGAGDRGDDPAGLGLATRSSCRCPQAISGAFLLGDLIYSQVPLLRQRLRDAGDRRAVAVPGEDALRRDHQGRRARQRDGAGARHQPVAAAAARVRARRRRWRRWPAW